MSRKARGVSLIVVYQRDLIPPDTVFLCGEKPQPPAEGRIVQVKGEHIHILVELPVSTTASSRREQELLDQVASLQALLNKSVHEFKVVVSLKRKAYQWSVNIEQATLEDIKTSICDMYHPPALENDGAELNFMKDGSGRSSPRNNVAFRDMLRLLVSKNNLKFTVVIETPLKAFSDWTFPKVCQLYGLGESDDPTMEVFPVFSCVIFGLNGHGPLDFTIDLRQTAKTVRVTEVKKDDFVKGVTQCVVQLELLLSNRKRKINEMEEDQPTFRRVFGIVTDAEKFYFMECTMDDQDRPNFKLSELMVVVYKDENLETKVEKVLGHIVWRRRSPTQLG
ncbi:hypothetical protein RhiirA5_431366 [Rhizophagus irregularis]|uniref:Crinkler family protein n=1 Tax=Rhizophagus irregularis TaxID=588596 RepID=A0A2N0NV47_9GLOM|nr:hypothetical protein RhiirA5_431366 [Rhizophagus irregularis]